MAVATTAPQVERPRDRAYDLLEERILARDQVGASQVFYDLVRAGRPLSEMVRETVRIHAPYTHVPFHQRHDSGDVRFVNNDHCLLSMRATVRLMAQQTSGLEYLPMAQTIWYIPTGLDPWNQLLGKAPGHYSRLMALNFTGSGLQPEVHWPDDQPADLGSMTLQERLDHWLTLVMRCQVEEAYRVVLALLADEANRQAALAQIVFAGLIDVQDRTLFRTSFTTGHRAYRARATIELADRVGWEQAHDIVYAGLLDLAVGPHWYSMYEMACTYCRLFLEGKDLEYRFNRKPLSVRQSEELVEVILDGDELAVVRAIGSLLQSGASIVSTIESIQLAAAEVLLRCGSPLGYNMPMHAYEYTNTVRWFYDRFDHPHAAKLLFVAGSFVNEVSSGLRAYPGNGPRRFRAPRGSAGWSDRQLLQRIDDAIVALRPDESAALTGAYLKAGYPRDALLRVLSSACSKLGNDPHNQEITHCVLEDWQKSAAPRTHRLAMSAAAFAAGHRKYGDPLEAYRRFAEAFGISTRQEAQGDAPVEQLLLDD